MERKGRRSEGGVRRGDCSGGESPRSREPPGRGPQSRAPAELRRDLPMRPSPRGCRARGTSPQHPRCLGALAGTAANTAPRIRAGTRSRAERGTCNLGSRTLRLGLSSPPPGHTPAAATAAPAPPGAARESSTHLHREPVSRPASSRSLGWAGSGWRVLGPVVQEARRR